MTVLTRSSGAAGRGRDEVAVPPRLAGITAARSAAGRSPERDPGPDRAAARRGLPLRGHLAVIMVLAVGVAGSGALYGRAVSEREAREAAGRSTALGAELTAQDIGDSLAELEAGVAGAAETPGLDQVFADPTGCTLTFAPVGPFALGRFDIVRPDGSIACSSAEPDPSGRGYRGADWLAAAMEAPTFVEGATQPTTGAAGVVHAAPVAGKGIMVGFLDLAPLGRALAEKRLGADRLEVVIVDRGRTTVLARSIEPSRWVERAVPPDAVSGAAGADGGPDLDGLARVHGQATVAGTGWHVFTGVEEADVVAAADGAFRRQLLIIVLGLLLLAVALVVLDRRVTGPIRRLSEAMGGGDGPASISRPVRVSGPREIVALGRDFNRMVAAVDRELVANGRLAAIVDSSDDAIIGMTLEGTVTSWNGGAVRLYGFRSDEMVGRNLKTLVAGDEPAAFQAMLDEVAAGHRVEHFEVHRERTDGTVMDFSVALSPVRDVGGNVEGASLCARDIGERKAAQRDLLRSNAELEQFAYVASHDLSEPLRTISGYVELLERRYRGQIDDDADRFIRHTAEGCSRMRQLIDDLLAFSRAGHGADIADAVDTTEVVAGVRSGMHAVLTDAAAVVTVGELPVVKGDRVQLAQLFQNLIANSVKFARPGTAPRIHIDARREAADWVFTVADDGIGIEPEYRERVFKMFQRLHGRDAYEGTGIGLAICMRIVQAHGGSIRIESGVDGGTVCRFTLPADEAVPA